MEQHAADDEVYWATVRAQYAPAPGFINLENGFFGMQARPVFAAYQRYEAEVNAEHSFFLRTRWAERLAGVRRALADFCGVDADWTVTPDDHGVGVELAVATKRLYIGHHELSGKDFQALQSQARACMEPFALIVAPQALAE